MKTTTPVAEPGDGDEYNEGSAPLAFLPAW